MNNNVYIMVDWWRTHRGGVLHTFVKEPNIVGTKRDRLLSGLWNEIFEFDGYAYLHGSFMKKLTYNVDRMLDVSHVKSIHELISYYEELYDIKMNRHGISNYVGEQLTKVVYPDDIFEEVIRQAIHINIKQVSDFEGGEYEVNVYVDDSLDMLISRNKNHFKLMDLNNHSYTVSFTDTKVVFRKSFVHERSNNDNVAYLNKKHYNMGEMVKRDDGSILERINVIREVYTDE